MSNFPGLVPSPNDERVFTTPDVIFASRIVIRSGMRPTRIVMRERRRASDGPIVEYIVHYEYLRPVPAPDDKGWSCSFEHAGFESGDYFLVADEPGRTAAEMSTAARKRFDERAAKL